MGKTEQVTWDKISDQFDQKKTTNEEGVSTNAYYYRGKLKPAVTIEINTRTSRKLCGYTLIENDIKDCFEFLEEYLRIINEENYNELIVKSLIKSLVITYGKCFTKAGVRGIKLEKKIFTQKNKNFHDEMIRMRHEYIAHAGSFLDEHCKFVMLLPPEKIFKKKNSVQPKGYRELSQRVHSPFFINDCKCLLEELRASLEEKISSLNDKMCEEVEVLSPDALYKIANTTTHNRCVLKQEDLEKMKR